MSMTLDMRRLQTVRVSLSHAQVDRSLENFPYSRLASGR